MPSSSQGGAELQGDVDMDGLPLIAGRGEAGDNSDAEVEGGSTDGEEVEEEEEEEEDAAYYGGDKRQSADRPPDRRVRRRADFRSVGFCCLISLVCSINSVHWEAYSNGSSRNPRHQI